MGESQRSFYHLFARNKRTKCEDSEFSSSPLYTRREEVMQLDMHSLNTISNMTLKRCPCTPCSSKSVSSKPAIQSVSKLSAMGTPHSTLLLLCGPLSMASIRKLSLLCPWQQQQQHRHWHKHAMGVTRLRTLRSVGLNWPLSCKFTGLHQRFTAWLELAEH